VFELGLRRLDVFNTSSIQNVRITQAEYFHDNEIYLLQADKNITQNRRARKWKFNQKKNRKEENKNEINVSIKVTGLYPNTLTNK